MKIIYVSTLISNKMLGEIINKSKKKPLQSIQKFHRLICRGLVKNNVKVKTISVIPMSRKISSKTLWFEKKEIEDKIEYSYVPFINIKILRQLCIFIFTIFKIIKELCEDKREKVFICDILNTTVSATTLVLSKIFKFKCIAIVTDLPRYMGKENRIGKKINQYLENQYDAYILLTEQMNTVINKRNKPCIIIEGVTDSYMNDIDVNQINKYKEKVCIYAGGLYEEYGVKNLVDAFTQLESSNIRLKLYGSGELDEYLKQIDDERIEFLGVVDNKKIVQEELKASLLINPRFTDQEYTKYSFPSKNMEYMSTGTAVLSTRLEGIPKEYFKYMYYFENENVDGMKKKLEEILARDISELNKKGLEAREFVLKYKNDQIQAKKILKLIEEILRG